MAVVVQRVKFIALGIMFSLDGKPRSLCLLDEWKGQAGSPSSTLVYSSLSVSSALQSEVGECLLL